LLRSGRPVFGIQARGLESSEQPFADLSEMIEAYVESILQIKSESPLNIIGYSAGCEIVHQLASHFEESGSAIGFVGFIDGIPFIDRSSKSPESLEEMLREMLRNYGLEIDDSVSYYRLRDLALNIFIEQNIVPSETPVTWIDRMLNEMNLSSQRLFNHIPKKGNFDAVYFSAEQGKISSQGIANGLVWEKYCRSVKFIPIQATHMNILDFEPSKAIAASIDKILDD
jgi:thioesterase domain-containing protein